MQAYHILNGDCLAHKFPPCIGGEMIVWRECLIDGPVSNTSFFENRKTFLRSTYGIEPDYDQMIMSEFERILKIPKKSHVYLWFEEDAFCQANLWFLVSELKNLNLKIFRILPDFSDNIFEGFGNSGTSDLDQLFQPFQASSKDLQIAMALWQFYQNDDFNKLEEISTYQSAFFPNFNKSVQAVIEIRSGMIKKLIESLKLQFNADWVLAFKKFSKEFPQYGLGDLQFEKLYF